MASGRESERDCGEFAAKGRACFDVGTNNTLAALRRDGAPRISASEMKFEGGEATFGAMGGSLKLLDVRRDPRIAVHSPTLEPPGDEPGGWPGDAKLVGTAVEMPSSADSPFPGAGFFRIDVTEVALTYVGDPPNHLVIEPWDPVHGYRPRTRM